MTKPEPRDYNRFVFVPVYADSMGREVVPADALFVGSKSQYQEYYDNAMREVGVRIPSPVLGQTVDDYRRKTLQALQHTLLPRNHKLSKVDFIDHETCYASRGP